MRSAASDRNDSQPRESANTAVTLATTESVETDAKAEDCDEVKAPKDVVTNCSVVVVVVVVVVELMWLRMAHIPTHPECARKRQR